MAALLAAMETNDWDGISLMDQLLFIPIKKKKNPDKINTKTQNKMEKGVIQNNSD